MNCFLPVDPLQGAEPNGGDRVSLVPELRESGNWDTSVTLRSGFGYKDNILLSSTNPEGGGLFRNSIDLTVFRLPVDGHQLSILIEAEDTRYPGGKSVRGEDIATLMVNYVYYAGDWEFGGLMQGVYQNQVFDVSSSEATLRTVRAEGFGSRIKPGVKRHFPGDWWISFSPGLHRQYFLQPLDSYWEGSVAATVGYSYGMRSEVAFEQELQHRAYDTRPPLDLNGVAIAGAGGLEFIRQESSLVWRHNWGEGRRWRLVNRIGGQRNHDNGSGYFDFWRLRIGSQLAYVNRSVEVRLGAYWIHHWYDCQPAVAGGIDKLQRDGWNADLRLEIPIRQEVRWFIQLELAGVDANQRMSDYQAHSAISGVAVEF